MHLPKRWQEFLSVTLYTATPSTATKCATVTSLTTDATGAKVSEMRYTWTAALSTTPAYALTKYTFTGQYSYMGDFGLMFYNARMYDPALGRFTSADTIIPPGPQGLDRYAYVNNAPVMFTDPSGHCPVCYFLAGAKLLLSFEATLFGARPDVEGVVATVAFTDTNDATVAAGLAVQSEYPWALFTGGKGLAQATSDELNGRDPFSSSVAEDVMSERTNDAIDECGTMCGDGVDKLIVAAIAQNGYDLDFDYLPLSEDDNTINWSKFFDSDIGSSTTDLMAQFRQDVTGMDYSAEFMLKLYMQDLRLLMKLGYDLPEWATEDDVRYIEETFSAPQDKE